MFVILFCRELYYDSRVAARVRIDMEVCGDALWMASAHAQSVDPVVIMSSTISMCANSGQHLLADRR